VVLAIFFFVITIRHVIALSVHNLPEPTRTATCPPKSSSGHGK
jgi:hypothetical protein